ncbi:TetR/AcrR family transcriptional regulator C-terminal domain-containing protein [Nonomuraea sp. NPDC049152]|uniref:TetR/AcrR family transcriptional regulator C-terminal domain-containing protein n=1 Tax=Nonomuraea sp. NPDC049152 TaxID=3154350 RepID=UPI00340AE55A
MVLRQAVRAPLGGGFNRSRNPSTAYAVLTSRMRRLRRTRRATTSADSDSCGACRSRRPGAEAGPDRRVDRQGRHRGRGRELYTRHPWTLLIVVDRPVLGPNVIGGSAAVLQALDGTGLTPAQILGAVNLIDAYVRGAVRRPVEAAEAERVSGVSTEEWWGARAGFWDTYFDQARFPLITRLWNVGAYDELGDDFEFGLQRVLDGIAAMIG